MSSLGASASVSSSLPAVESQAAFLMGNAPHPTGNHHTPCRNSLSRARSMVFGRQCVLEHGLCQCSIPTIQLSVQESH